MKRKRISNDEAAACGDNQIRHAEIVKRNGKTYINPMDEIDPEEQVEQLERAAELIAQASAIITEVTKEDAEVECYLTNRLDHVAEGTGNPYDLCIPKLIERIKKDPEKYNFVDHSGDYQRNK